MARTSCGGYYVTKWLEPKQRSRRVLDAKLYRNTGEHTSPSWSEVRNVKGLTLNLEATEADVSTRGSGGWRASIASLKDTSLEFQMFLDTADDDFTAVYAAFLTRAPIEFAVLDGDVAIAGSQGLRASMVITSFRWNPLAEPDKASVTAKPSHSDNAPEWMTVPSGISDSCGD